MIRRDRESWRDRAACALEAAELQAQGSTPEEAHAALDDLFHGGPRWAVHAKRLCRGCPVLAQCEAYTDRLEALVGPQPGIYAAKEPHERRALAGAYPRTSA